MKPGVYFAGVTPRATELERGLDILPAGLAITLLPITRCLNPAPGRANRPLP